MHITKIKEEHWRQILDIQDVAYKTLVPETLDVLQSKHDISPNTCFVALSDKDNVMGYLLAHPWKGAQPPKLYESISLPTYHDEIFLHDLAICPCSSGKGVGRAMFFELKKAARCLGIKAISLVAVQGSERFWSAMGFEKVEEVNVCMSYGKDAVFMRQKLEGMTALT